MIREKKSSNKPSNKAIVFAVYQIAIKAMYDKSITFDEAVTITRNILNS